MLHRKVRKLKKDKQFLVLGETTTLAGEITGTTLGGVKQNYIIMMFDQPVTSSSPLHQ
jgi:hypothetical protein